MSSGFVRWGGLAGVVGGALWAVTPLRQPIFGGGGVPGHPVFRPYNFALLVIAVLLMLGLLALHAKYKGRYGRVGLVGVAVTFVGYALLFGGSIPAVALSGEGSTSLIMAGQDLGFLGALVSGVGAVLLGIALWRTTAASPLGALLLITALPVGMVGTILVSAIGLLDIAGLPLTVLYGAAWITLGSRLWSQGDTKAQPRVT